jgi:hypothetical protein
MAHTHFNAPFTDCKHSIFPNFSLLLSPARGKKQRTAGKGTGGSFQK